MGVILAKGRRERECQERRDDCGVDSDSYYDSDLEDLEADEDSDADTDREFDDNTESEEEEEEEDAETDQKTGGDGSDFCLPSGHWLRSGWRSIQFNSIQSRI